MANESSEYSPIFDWRGFIAAYTRKSDPILKNFQLVEPTECG